MTARQAAERDIRKYLRENNRTYINISDRQWRLLCIMQEEEYV